MENTCDVRGNLEALSHAVALLQHHDAVTGTEKQYVAEDYHYRLDKAVRDFMYCASKQDIGIGHYYCPFLNISQCNASENSSTFTVSVYNPLARIRSAVVRIPIIDGRQTAVVAYKVTTKKIFVLSSKLYL